MGYLSVNGIDLQETLENFVFDESLDNWDNWKIGKQRYDTQTAFQMRHNEKGNIYKFAYTYDNNDLTTNVIFDLDGKRDFETSQQSWLSVKDVKVIINNFIEKNRNKNITFEDAQKYFKNFNNVYPMECIKHDEITMSFENAVSGTKVECLEEYKRGMRKLKYQNPKDTNVYVLEKNSDRVKGVKDVFSFKYDFTYRDALEFLQQYQDEIDRKNGIMPKRERERSRIRF